MTPGQCLRDVPAEDRDAFRAAYRVAQLALGCWPVPEELAERAREYIDRRRIRNPYSTWRTVDGRDARTVWGERWRDSIELAVERIAGRPPEAYQVNEREV